jgi:magnesium transporter
MQFEMTDTYLEELRDAIDAAQGKHIRLLLEELENADAALVLQELDDDEGAYILQQLDLPAAAMIIRELDPSFRERFLKQYHEEEVAKFLLHLETDDAADILNELSGVRQAESIISRMADEEKAAHILELLHYDADCAGGLMAKELIKANIHWNIRHCREEIRRQSKQVEKFYAIYVIDDVNRLVGKVSMKRLFLADDDALIKDIYDDDIMSVSSYAPDYEVAEIMKKYDLDSLPVVNLQGKLIGRITIDDIVDVITEQADMDRQAMTGISTDVEEDDSIWMLSKSRLPWLFIGLAGGMMAAQLMGLFEGFLREATAMAFFIPLITATGGNVGIQASSLIVQSLARLDADNSFGWERFSKTLLVATLNGLALASLVFVLNFFIMGDVILSLVVAIALFSVVVLSSFMGTITPLILDRFNINPAVASGPFITTANDIIGLAVYFSIAYLLYQP